MSDETVIAALMELVKANTAAINTMSQAVNENASASATMASEMVHLRATIAGAQRKIGGEIGPMIDKMKETQAAIQAEKGELLNAKTRSEAAQRSGADEGPPSGSTGAGYGNGNPG